MGTNANPDSKIGIVGTGYWGKNLVRNYYELGALKTICDTDKQTLATLTKMYEGVNATRDFNDLLENPEIEGIVISLPAEMHYQFAKRALEADKHILVEKPLALKLEEAEELVSLSRKNSRILMVGHLMQYHPAFIRLKKMVLEGELGKIYYIYSNRLSLGKIRREENSLWSFAPHDISMILSLCQEAPIRIYAIGGNYLQHKIADVTVTHMTFPSGIKSHVFVSWLHPFKEQKLVVVGEEKMAVFSDIEDWENKLLLYSHSMNWENGVPVPQKADPERIAVERIEPLRNECLHFLECIEGNKQPVTDGPEGLSVLKVLQEAQSYLEMHSIEV